MASVLRGRRVVLRPAVPGDAVTLAPILAEPAVARWFAVAEGEAERVAREWVADEDAVPYVVEVDGEVAGSVQSYEEPDPYYRHAGMDIFLAPRHHGRGLGPEALRLLAAHLIDDCGHHRLIIDPAAANTRAIRAYERIGFRPVGVMREYERTADGTWRDGLLMDMLAAELVRE